MTTFLGYFDQPNPGVAARMEESMGLGFRAIRLNYGFNDFEGKPKGGGKYLDKEYDRILARWGYAPRGFWNMNLEPPLTFGVVAAGQADDVLIARAQLIRDNPRWTHDHPLFVSPHHEQSVDTHRIYAPDDPQYDDQPGGGDPADYPAFFKRVYDVFAQEGVLRNQGGSVMLCFVGTAPQFYPVEKLPKWKQPWHMTAIAPDPKHYAYTGTDIYSKPDYKRPDARDLDYVNAWAASVGKKYVIGECGASMSDTPGQQAGWIKDVHQRIKSHGTKDGPGSCNMVAWTFKDFGDSTSTRVDTDPTSMAAFTELAKDPAFQRKV